MLLFQTPWQSPVIVNCSTRSKINLFLTCNARLPAQPPASEYQRKSLFLRQPLNFWRIGSFFRHENQPEGQDCPRRNEDPRARRSNFDRVSIPLHLSEFVRADAELVTLSRWDRAPSDDSRARAAGLAGPLSVSGRGWQGFRTVAPAD